MLGCCKLQLELEDAVPQKQIPRLLETLTVQRHALTPATTTATVASSTPAPAAPTTTSASSTIIAHCALLCPSMGQQACYRDRLLSAQISINLARQYLADAARRGYFCACTVHRQLILLVLVEKIKLGGDGGQAALRAGWARQGRRQSVFSAIRRRNAVPGPVLRKGGPSEILNDVPGSRRFQKDREIVSLLARYCIGSVPVLGTTLICTCYVACQSQTSIIALEKTLARVHLHGLCSVHYFCMC